MNTLSTTLATHSDCRSTCQQLQRGGIRCKGWLGAWLAALLIVAPSAPHAQCLPGGDHIILPLPQCPTARDDIILTVDGWFGNLCWWPMAFDSSRADADTVWIYATELHAGYRGCFQVIVEYSFPVHLPKLQPGTHPLVMRVDVLPAFDSSEYAGTYFCNSSLTVYSPGDVNYSGSLTITDIVGLVNHLFRGHPPPACNTGDVNCDGSMSIADVMDLVAYIFKSGPAPLESCAP